MTRNEEYLKTIMDALGGDSTKIPPYTINSEDDLKYIAAALEERAANKGRFVVNCTPTGAYTGGGTADKTVKEINDAYSAGKEILFRLPISSSITLDLPATYVHHTDGASNVVFGWTMIGGSAIIRYAFTSNTDNTNTYSAQSTSIGS